MYLSFFGILIGKITYGDSKMFNKMCINYQKLKKKSGLKVNVLIASTIKGKKVDFKLQFIVGTLQFLRAARLLCNNRSLSRNIP